MEGMCGVFAVVCDTDAICITFQVQEKKKQQAKTGTGMVVATNDR